MKRTTLILDTALYAELRHRAAREGRTLTDTVEQALRLGLAGGARTRRPRRTLPSFDLGPFLLDPADRTAVPRPARRRRETAP